MQEGYFSTELTEMTPNGESLVRPVYMQDDRDSDDLQNRVDAHETGDDLPSSPTPLRPSLLGACHDALGKIQ